MSSSLLSCTFLFLFFSVTAKAEEVILRHSFAGNISFELAGNTLRRNNNTCLPRNSGQSSSTIRLPNNSTVKAAYLYWSGSGDVDSTAVLNGQSINADVSYIESFQSRDYYSSKADVTAFVSNNRTTQYTVSGVTFDGSNTYCASAGAYGGWALTVIYENSNEALRVINLFDGFKNFWGEQFSLIPDNFVIAQNPASKGGKHAHITWEGDEGNSQSRNNQTESLRFEGVNLTDSDNPFNNQFNGYSNVTGRTSGVDVDEYDIGNYLTAGATQVNTTYSSGQDAVFLTAELISVPNEPVSDLSIQQTGPNRFVKGQVNNVEFTIDNLGPNTALSNSQLTIPLINGLSLSSFTGNNWSCTSSSTDISCLYSDSINKDNTSSALTVSFAANESTSNNINLVSTVNGILFDNVLSNNTQSKTYSVVSPNLTTSTKTVTDLNGGNVQAGDILRYQIDIVETNGIAATGVALTDHLDVNIESFSLVNLPSAITNNSQPAPAGNNTSGLVSLTNINVIANGTTSIIIDAKIKPSINSNTSINNTATLSSLGLPDISIVAPEVFISSPISPAEGNKPLYLHQNNSLSRIKPTSSAFITLADQGQHSWIITPPFQQTFSFSNSQINAYLFLQNDYINQSWNHTLTLELLLNGSPIASAQETVTIPSQGLPGDNVGLFDFSITIPSGQLFQPGETLALRISNDSQFNEDSLRVYSIDPNTSTSDAVSPNSLISLPAETVINVDQITVLNATTSQIITEAYPTQNLLIQTTVSDPFGSFDITSALISIIDSTGNQVVNQQNMSVLSDSGAATKDYQFNYSLPANADIGDWKITITAKEGSEDEISHSSDYILNVIAALPNITITKSVEVFSDPIHGENTNSSFSKALPGAILTYTLSAKNTGLGPAANNSIWISDIIPSNTFMIVSDFNNSSGIGPLFEDASSNTSSLSYSFSGLGSATDDLEFSSNNGATFDYSPTIDANGLDTSITNFRINPKGIFAASANGQSSTDFVIKFRVQLQ